MKTRAKQTFGIAAALGALFVGASPNATAADRNTRPTHPNSTVFGRRSSDPRGYDSDSSRRGQTHADEQRHWQQTHPLRGHNDDRQRRDEEQRRRDEEQRRRDEEQRRRDEQQRQRNNTYNHSSYRSSAPGGINSHWGQGRNANGSTNSSGNGNSAWGHSHNRRNSPPPPPNSYTRDRDDRG